MKVVVYRVDNPIPIGEVRLTGDRLVADERVQWMLDRFPWLPARERLEEFADWTNGVFWTSSIQEN